MCSLRATCGAARRLCLTAGASAAFESVMAGPKCYRLIGPDGAEVLSDVPGTFGGHRRTRVYGRLDCAGALRWIAKGHYVCHRVFFADEETAIAAGYRPCANCMPEEYRTWKAAQVKNE